MLFIVLNIESSFQIQFFAATKMSTGRNSVISHNQDRSTQTISKSSFTAARHFYSSACTNILLIYLHLKVDPFYFLSLEQLSYTSVSQDPMAPLKRLRCFSSRLFSVRRTREALPHQSDHDRGQQKRSSTACPLLL
jgi:hypothetical protein